MSTSVFFIGGWHAKPDHIASWVRSAQLKKPSVAFTGFPWPGDVTSWPPKDIVQGWKDKKQYQPVLDAIKACTADKIYIVGHSSGCAVSNAVDNDLNDPKRYVLVALDGVAPNDAQLNRNDTQVWSAKSGDNVAKNYWGLFGTLKARLQVYQARTDCTTRIALHFAVVNAAATDKLVADIPHGYTNCEANLMWLKT